MPKRNDNAVDLHAQLQASLAGAEAAVVDAAVDLVEFPIFRGDNVAEPLREAVTNLMAIRAGISAMDKTLAKSKPKPEAPAPKLVSGPVTRPAVPATAKA